MYKIVDVINLELYISRLTPSRGLLVLYIHQLHTQPATMSELNNIKGRLALITGASGGYAQPYS
jgi:hypothetical protein